MSVQSNSSFVSRGQQVVFDWASCLICSFPALKLFLWMPRYPSVTPALEWDTQNSSLSSFSVLSPPLWSSAWCTGWSWVLWTLHQSIIMNHCTAAWDEGWFGICHSKIITVDGDAISTGNRCRYLDTEWINVEANPGQTRPLKILLLPGSFFLNPSNLVLSFFLWCDDLIILTVWVLWSENTRRSLIWSCFLKVFWCRKLSKGPRLVADTMPGWR